LVVDDDDAILEEVAEVLTSIGHGYDLAATQEEARELLADNQYAYVLLDLEIPVRSGRGKPRIQNGENLLEEITSAKPGMPVIIMTDLAAETADVACEIMRLATSMARKGAADFINKPFPTAGRTLDRVIRKNLKNRPRGQAKATPEKPRAFAGGQLTLFPDHVELCGVRVLGDLGLGQMRAILDELKATKANGSRAAYSGAELARRIGARGGQNTVAGCIRDFRNTVIERLRDEANILCDRQDVIQSGGRGYRLADWIEVVDQGAGTSQGHARGHCRDIEGTSRGHVPSSKANVPSAAPDVPLNDRQHWVLEQLRSGAKVQRDVLQKRFKIVPKTAKRDLAELRKRGLIEFVRTPRPGYYRLRKRHSAS
jgi:FixJ family two-component response regulator